MSTLRHLLPYGSLLETLKSEIATDAVKTVNESAEDEETYDVAGFLSALAATAAPDYEIHSDTEADIFLHDNPTFTGLAVAVDYEATAVVTSSGDSGDYDNAPTGPEFEHEFDFQATSVMMEGEVIVGSKATFDTHPDKDALLRVIGSTLRRSIDWEAAEDAALNRR